MLIGVIADDFTGASDIANTLARGLPGGGGLRTMQYLGVPTQPAAKDVEAGVVSLKSRSIPASEAVTLALEALRWLRAQGCRQFVFKYCSTFDSTPLGNIGPVAEALAGQLGVKGVTVCPAFPAAGRTLYQGHLFVHDQLLSESTLRQHPLNPMVDPDIRRWLRLQCSASVGWIPWTVVNAGPAALRGALDARAARGETLIVVDAVRDEDLVTIGHASQGIPLLTGGSGIAIALPDNFLRVGLAMGVSASAVRMPGPEAILAGSCSEATRHQIEMHAKDHPILKVNVELAMTGAVNPRELAEFINAHKGEAPLIYASDDPQRCADLQRKFSRKRISGALDTLFADTARILVAGGVRRLIVAGGETSGAIVGALGIAALAIGQEIDPGVPALIAAGPQPLALALKSGNFGAPDFFAKALRQLAGEA